MREFELNISAISFNINHHTICEKFVVYLIVQSYLIIFIAENDLFVIDVETGRVKIKQKHLFTQVICVCLSCFG